MTKEGALYGQSLYDLAAEENLSDEILQQIDAVKDILAQNPDYITLLSEPSVPKKDRLALLDDAFKGQIHLYLLNFMKLLLENGMLRGFNECANKYKEMYNAAHGISEAVVTSAIPLTEKQLDQLKVKLEKITGKTILLTEKTDPAVLGGLCVEVDGKLFDGTVMGRLTDLRKKVNETVV